MRGLDLLEQRRHLLFLARVAAIAKSLPAVGTDGLDQRLQLVGAAPGQAGGVAALGKSARDGATGGIASAYHQRYAGWTGR